MSRWMIAFFIFIFATAMIRVEKRKEVLLGEIALNLGEISMSLDNVVALKDEVMMDLDERLPDWAWNKEKP